MEKINDYIENFIEGYKLLYKNAQIFKNSWNTLDEEMDLSTPFEEVKTSDMRLIISYCDTLTRFTDIKFGFDFIESLEYRIVDNELFFNLGQTVGSFKDHNFEGLYFLKIYNPQLFIKENDDEFFHGSLINDVIHYSSLKFDIHKNEIHQKTYLMLDSNTNLYKIGKSKDPKFREKTLQSEKPTISLFAVCEKDIESELHNKFSDKRIRGEWFDLNKDDVKWIMDYFKELNK